MILAYNGNRTKQNPFRDVRTQEAGVKRRGSFFGAVLRLFLLILIGCVAAVTGVATQGYLFFTNSLPSVEKLRSYTPPIVTNIYGQNGQLIGDFASERRYVVSLDEVPQALKDAFIAAEDKNFRTHKGVDETAIVRAIKLNVIEGKVKSGASTITQQVAKTFLLTPERKFSRKIQEAILATRIEGSLSKEKILYLYLNQIYLGSASYGVEAAARTYFGKHVKDLTVAECAMMAGLPQRPAKYSPKVNLKASLERRAYVLRRMLEDGYIAQDQHDQANQEEPRLVGWTNPNKKSAPDFTEHVRRYIEQKYGPDILYKEGLQVYTTVDLELTRAAEKAMDEGLRELDKRQGYRGPIKTLNVKGVMEFLEERTHARKEPLRFGEITEGVVTKIDDQNVYVRMGSYIGARVKKEYVGLIKIDPSRDWWVRQPYIRQELRTKNFAQGDLPFQVGDLILVRLVDPNAMRRDMYLKKFGKTDPDLKNYRRYTEEMVDYFPLEVEQDPVVEAALMLRDNRTGYVRVLLGGRSFSEANYNRATQARRQPGSSFKPVIYAAALNKGFTCADIILDSPMALSIPGTGEIWRPRNYRGGFQGPVTFRDAIVKSRNIPTIKILQQIGVEQAKAYAKKLGYTSPLANNLTMALGSMGVSVEEQVAAFSTFPNRGYLIPNVYVTKIVDRNGKILEENPPPILLDDPLQPDQSQIQKVSLEMRAASGPGEPAEKGTSVLRRRLDDGTAYIMCSLLQGVVQDGTATVLKKIVGRPDIAGKTGTTNECLDAWFVGFSPDFTCGVWVGFDDESTLGVGETGGKAAAPIWGYFMKEVLAKVPVKEFPASKAVEFRKINARTGLATSAPEGFQEVFKVGSGPYDTEPGLVKGARWDYSGSDIDQF